MNALVIKHCAGQPLRLVIESLVRATELVSHAQGRGEGALYDACFGQHHTLLHGARRSGMSHWPRLARPEARREERACYYEM